MLDLLIKNGLVYDGNGGIAYQADIGVREDKIAVIGTIEEDAAIVIDAAGKVVTPGFFDPHCHVDTTVILAPQMESYLKQGVTTVIGGNCGHAIAPMGKEVFRGPLLDTNIANRISPNYFEDFPLMYDRTAAEEAFRAESGIELNWNSLEEFMDVCDGLSMGGNMALLTGYSAVRSAVMGMDCLRPATEEELDQLEKMVRDCMESGAYGFSTGRDPQYIPGPMASMEEMTRMLRVVKEYDGIFASHTYNISPEGQFDPMGGYREMVELAKAADVRMNVSHAHVMGMAITSEQAASAAQGLIDYFDSAIADGVDLSFDVIPSPFCADFTFPYFAFFIKPLVLMSGTRAHLAENFLIPDFRKMVHIIVEQGMMPSFDIKSPRNWFGRMYIIRHKKEAYIGKTFLGCAELLGVEPLDALMQMFAEDPDMQADLTSFDFEKAVDLLCSHSKAMPCSDGISYAKEKNLSTEETPLYLNAMNISFIPRYLLREGKEDFGKAVYKASKMVAERFGIERRGSIEVGNFADLVVIDRKNLKSYDRSDNPLQDPDGFDYVIVNGQIAVENKKIVTADAGRLLRKNIL